MKNLNISESTARKLYKTATPELKEILIESFGKDFFSSKITDRIKTFEDACEEIGTHPKYVILSTDNKNEAAYKKLKVIAAALNGDWKPDWSNSSESKFYPWFEFVPGSGWSFNDFAYWFTHSLVGSRLCFKSEELAKYAGKQFIEIYNDFFNF